MTNLKQSRSLFCNRSGVVTVEFAFIFPLLLILFVGVVEIGQALTVSRKLNQVAATTADLVSQQDKLSNSEMDDIFAGAEAIMQPYEPDELKILACVIDTTGMVQIVKWCSAFQDDALTAGSDPFAAIPDDMVEDGVDTIAVRAEYHFATPFSKAIAIRSGGYDFDRTVFARSRLGDDVDGE